MITWALVWAAVKLRRPDLLAGIFFTGFFDFLIFAAISPAFQAKC